MYASKCRTIGINGPYTQLYLQLKMCTAFCNIQIKKQEPTAPWTINIMGIHFTQDLMVNTICSVSFHCFHIWTPGLKVWRLRWAVSPQWARHVQLPHLSHPWWGITGYAALPCVPPQDVPQWSFVFIIWSIHLCFIHLIFPEEDYL